jgi:hypothetical protein
MIVRTIILSLLTILLGVSAASAGGAPAHLRGKSVIASWTEQRLQRLGGIGEFTGRSYFQQLNVYISSEGRLFVRRTIFRRFKSADQNSVSSNEQGPQKTSITGRSLAVTWHFGSGGLRLARIEFSPDFSSCTANVIMGRENGTAIARGRSLFSGDKVEIKEAHVTNTNCSMREGNVFDQ